MTRWRSRIAAALIAGGAVGAVLRAAEPPPEAERYVKLYRKAAKAQKAGRHEKALTLYERLLPLAPENAGPHLQLARSFASLGQDDAAFAALARAIDLGYPWADPVVHDELLEPLHDDARWGGALARLERNEAQWKAELETLYGEVPPASAERYGSLDALTEAFAGRMGDFETRRPLLGFPLQLVRQAEILDAKLAALERFLAEASAPDEREAAALEALHTALAYKDGWPSWGGDSALVAAQAERFLADYPASEHRPEVLLQRAVAAWKAHGEDDARETLAARSAEARVWLDRLEAEHAGSSEAGRAPVWRLAIEHALAGGGLTPEQLALHAALAPRLAEDEAFADYAWEHADAPLFRIEAAEAFEGTDLAGQRWDWEAMRGRVVLIDFWATWCGPCVGELPNLREAYSKYHDRGFEIVGVSLDGGSRKAFEKECAKHEIVWPQIWDGKGWETTLARRFRIRGVPTPVLLDREGNIAAMHEDARGEKLVERVGELVGAPAD